MCVCAGVCMCVGVNGLVATVPLQNVSYNQENEPYTALYMWVQCHVGGCPLCSTLSVSVRLVRSFGVR